MFVTDLQKASLKGGVGGRENHFVSNSGSAFEVKALCWYL